MKRTIVSTTIALILLLLVASVVYAAISAPDTLELNQAEVYRHNLEMNDQLYLISFTDYYASPPSEGNIDELFVVRLRNNAGAELASVTPVVDTTAGTGFLGSGIISIYFTADTASTWNPAATYSVEIAGNPSLDWGGDPPIATNTELIWHADDSMADSEDRLTIRLRSIARALESNWGGTTDLREKIAGEWKLTEDGEEYFTDAIPGLLLICPDLFAAVTSSVTFEDREHTQSYAEQLAAALTGTNFDFTPLGNNIGLSSMWISTIIWFAISIGMGWIVAYYTNSFRPAMLTILFMMPLGTLAGFMPLIIAVVGAFLCGVGTIYVFFYRQTA